MYNSMTTPHRPQPPTNHQPPTNWLLQIFGAPANPDSPSSRGPWIHGATWHAWRMVGAEMKRPVKNVGILGIHLNPTMKIDVFRGESVSRRVLKTTKWTNFIFPFLVKWNMMFEKHQQFGGEFGCLSSFSLFFERSCHVQTENHSRWIDIPSGKPREVSTSINT